MYVCMYSDIRIELPIIASKESSSGGISFLPNYCYPKIILLIIYYLLFLLYYYYYNYLGNNFWVKIKLRKINSSLEKEKK